MLLVGTEEILAVLFFVNDEDGEDPINGIPIFNAFPELLQR